MQSDTISFIIYTILLFSLDNEKLRYLVYDGMMYTGRQIVSWFVNSYRLFPTQNLPNINWFLLKKTNNAVLYLLKAQCKFCVASLSNNKECHCKLVLCGVINWIWYLQTNLENRFIIFRFTVIWKRRWHKKSTSKFRKSCSCVYIEDICSCKWSNAAKQCSSHGGIDLFFGSSRITVAVKIAVSFLESLNKLQNIANKCKKPHFS